VRLKVTPIGSARLGGADVAAAIVEYLEGTTATNGPPTGRQLLAVPRGPGLDGVAMYYADSIEGPGAWLGRGARRLGLDGVVGREEFQRVLEGRHPATGERLLHAQGSAGRASLAVGTETRRTDEGEWVYDVHDAASALGLDRGDIEALIDAGDRRRAGDTEVAWWLDAIVEHDGERLVTDGELERYAAAQTDSAKSMSPLGSHDREWLSTAEAAAALGMSAQYVRGCCRYWERHRDEIAALMTVGLPALHAWMECERVDDAPQASYRIHRDAVKAFAARRVPPVVRVGFDLTLTAAKSVSVMTMLSSGARQDRLVAAFDAANQIALRYMEEHTAVTRRAGTTVRTEGLVVASYLHGTSRALDPFPHRHNIVANSVIDNLGDRKTLDARLLFSQAPAAAALATAELHWRLSRDLGVDWVHSPTGAWELAGFPDAAIEAFSTRRREIDDALTEMTATLQPGRSAAQADRAAKATRARKAPPQNRKELLAWWRTRARRAGLNRRAIESCFGREPLLYERLPEELASELFEQLAGVDGVTAEHSSFSRPDVLRWIARWTMGDTGDEPRLVVMPAAEVERLADVFLASRSVIELAGRGTRASDVIERRDGRRVDATGGQPTFSTVRMVELQSWIAESFAAGRSLGIAVAADGHVTEIVGALGLTNEQAEFVVALTTSGDRVQCGIGRPGTGKTFSLAAAARLWEQSGYRVLGAAVKGEAARLLGATANIESETVAWYLASLRVGRITLDPSTVLVIDEASTLGDRDLAELLRAIRPSGAALRLVGDPAQHGAVPAGGMFAALCRRAGQRTPELTVPQRQRLTVDINAAEAVRHGRVAQAIATLAAAGQLRVVRNNRELYVDLLTRWLAARAAGAHHPMVDRRNRVRLVLNHLAHQLLQQDGTVATGGLVVGDGREFCVGDEVIARRPNRDLHPDRNRRAYIRNGSRGTVVSVRRGSVASDDALEVEFEQLGLIVVPRVFVESYIDARGRAGIGLDHAYAITSYAVQGATFPVSTSVVTAGTRRNELYVNVTRGQQDNYLYAVRASDPLGGEGHLPRPPAPDPIQEVVRSASRPAGEQPAWVIDPNAAAVARRRGDRSLAEIHRRRRAAELTGDLDDVGLWTRAETVTGHAVARLALLNPPPEVTRGLGERPTIPWLAAQWDATIAAVAIYRETYDTIAGPGSWTWAIGQRPVDGDAGAAWDATAASLTDLVAAIGQRTLRDADIDFDGDDASWSTDHLVRLGGHGLLAARLAGLPDLYRAVKEYRRTHGVSPIDDRSDATDTELLLGRRPPRSTPSWFAYRRMARRAAQQLGVEPEISRSVG
jgi:conjugative relaxase-like TrwC/TraI family protein